MLREVLLPLVVPRERGGGEGRGDEQRLVVAGGDHAEEVVGEVVPVALHRAALVVAHRGPRLRGVVGGGGGSAAGSRGRLRRTGRGRRRRDGGRDDDGVGSVHGFLLNAAGRGRPVGVRGIAPEAAAEARPVRRELPAEGPRARARRALLGEGQDHRRALDAARDRDRRAVATGVPFSVTFTPLPVMREPFCRRVRR